VPRIRLFVETALVPGASLGLDAARSHYLAGVMRARPGETVRLFNGRDGEFAAQVAAVARRGVTLVVGEATRPQPQPPAISLVIAAVKRDALDLIARAATELGVGAIRPVFTARTNAGRVGTARLRAIAIEAAEQCGRCDVPEIAEPMPLADLLAAWPADQALVVADERGGAPPALTGLDGLAPPIAVLIGPEGGFTAAELDAPAVRAFVTPISLGPRILRAETAAIAALALVQARCGDWRSDRPARSF
jgi:16S rRNA (uracil1498-N3)-methyltransferase